jgi:hypothetical protein
MAKKPEVGQASAESQELETAFSAPASRVANRPGTDSLKTIAIQVRAKQDAQTAIDSAVIKARHDGCSWVQIATALGVSPQGARQKYLARVPL